MKKIVVPKIKESYTLEELGAENFQFAGTAMLAAPGEIFAYISFTADKGGPSKVWYWAQNLYEFQLKIGDCFIQSNSTNFLSTKPLDKKPDIDMSSGKYMFTKEFEVGSVWNKTHPYEVTSFSDYEPHAFRRTSIVVRYEPTQDELIKLVPFVT